MISERDAFRSTVALAGLVPVFAGLAGMVFGAGAFTDGPIALDVSLDSHVRYLSGLLFGVGVAFWATLEAPERHTARYRLLTAVVFLGGLARLWGVAAVGPANWPMTLALAMELLVTPAICLWQARIARRAPHPPR